MADRASGRWSNRLAALVVNAVPSYRTGDVAAAVVPESRVMLAPTVGGGSSLRVNPVEANWADKLAAVAECHDNVDLPAAELIDDNDFQGRSCYRRSVITLALERCVEQVAQ